MGGENKSRETDDDDGEVRQGNAKVEQSRANQWLVAVAVAVAVTAVPQWYGTSL